MSRPASDWTEAVRQLCKETKGKITHIEARPKLMNMGCDVLPDDTDRGSDEWKAEANAFNTVKYQWRVANGFVPGKPKKKRPKSATRANSAPPPKYGSGKKTSTKKTSTKKTTRRTGRRRTAPATDYPVEFEVSTALEFVKEHGGMSAVTAEIAEMEAKTASFKAAVAKLNELQSELNEVA